MIGVRQLQQQHGKAGARADRDKMPCQARATGGCQRHRGQKADRQQRHEFEEADLPDQHCRGIVFVAVLLGNLERQRVEDGGRPCVGCCSSVVRRHV
jgi:hypothetical protein